MIGIQNWTKVYPAVGLNQEAIYRWCYSQFGAPWSINNSDDYNFDTGSKTWTRGFDSKGYFWRFRNEDDVAFFLLRWS